MPVVDASVLVASLHRDEPGHEASVAFVRRCAAHRVPLVTPTIAVPEVASAVRRGGDDQLALRTVDRLLASRILELRDVGSRLAELSGVLASAYGLRGCDAVYVALAQLTESKLVSLDRDQHARGRDVVDVVAPADWQPA